MNLDDWVGTVVVILGVTAVVIGALAGFGIAHLLDGCL